jgi:hypothetical protein
MPFQYGGNEALKLRPFDLGGIKPGFLVILIGTTLTGKSFCLRNIMYTMRHVPRILIISGSEAVSPFFGNHIPGCYIKPEYNEKYLEDLMRLQTRVKQDPNIRNKQAILVMDDTGYSADRWKRSENLVRLAQQGRHFCVTTFIVVQDPMAVPPKLRNNAKYVFLCRDNILSQQEKLYQHYAGMVPNVRQWINTMNKYTKDYRQVVIDRTSKSTNVQDCIFHFRARDPGPFYMCPKETWDRWRRKLEKERIKAQRARLSTRYANTQFNPNQLAITAAPQSVRNRGGGS